MRFWHLASACLAALATASVATETTEYSDAETGFKFAQCIVEYDLGKALTFRVAVPAKAPSMTDYDIVLQVVAPAAVGWVGFAWSGRMVGDPLTVAWPSGGGGGGGGGGVVLSPRRAVDHSSVPPVDAAATLTLLSKGTHINATAVQYTLRCRGCTYFKDRAGDATWIYATGINDLSFAMSSADKPATPASPSSSLPKHDVTYSWRHDFALGENADFDALVAKNT